MSKVSLRRLLSRLTTIALSASTVGVASADPSSEDGGTSCSHSDCVLVEDLPIDREHLDAPDAAAALGRSLALALDKMRPISATQIASTWALSDDGVRRLAVVHALEWSFKLVGDDIILDHLSRDPDPAVRTATARAAWARRQVGTAVLDRLKDDPDPEVRAVAEQAG
ncbi:MAG: hypothetical protein SFX73_26845 [Kofleriaceae bacterium]|nr:hypothetical protein [Kofleriaceae bacterium]